ncbi:ABC transporter ATP-binding protein [Bacillus weihaiensis]|nr:ABC transporter ATP-binding protein [Bacillus weihaiensis]
MTMIKCKNVNKSFGNHQVVKDFNLAIKEGEVFGLLGPNGAGKTTTISMMTSQIYPTSGEISINGLNIVQNQLEVKKAVGIVPQDIALYPMLSAIDNLTFFGELYGIKGKKAKEKVNQLLHLVGLADRAKEPIKNYSGGMKRRINIAAALLHDPLVVFMDEPTVGIDPQSRNQIFELVNMLKENGMTIIYTTHYMEEATKLCDRVAIIDDGKIISLGTVEELVAQVHGGVIELSTVNSTEADFIEEGLKTRSFCKNIRRTGTHFELVVEDMNDNVAKLLEWFKSSQFEATITNIMNPSLETLFLYKTGKKLRD